MDLTTAAKNLKLDALGDVATHVSLHTAYPSTGGTNEVSGGSYAREAVTWNAASGGSMAASAALTFDVPAATSVGWAGLWSASTAGTFYGSVALGPDSEPKIAVGLSSDTLYSAAHGFADDDVLVVADIIGDLPAGLAEGDVVHVISSTTDSFSVSSTSGGGAINITAGGVAMFHQIIVEAFSGAGQYTLTTLTVNEG